MMYCHMITQNITQIKKWKYFAINRGNDQSTFHAQITPHMMKITLEYQIYV